MELLITAFAESIVQYVDDRFGRAAAWVASLVVLALLLGFAVGLVWWFLFRPGP
jgi:hypothetical protein